MSDINLCEDDRKYFFLPVNTGYVKNGTPTDQYIEFYRKRSGNGIYCVIVGNVVIPDGFASNSVCAEISKSKIWECLARSITSEGAKAGIQLSTTWKNYYGIRGFTPSCAADAVSEYKAVLANTSPRKITKIFENLRRGIDLSVNAGFTHIQVHAGHGYLFSLLVDEEFCKYDKLAIAHLDQIATELNSAKIESSMRFSLITGNAELDENRSKLIDEIFSLPFSFFDISFGFYNINKYLIYPVADNILKKRLHLSLAVAYKFPDRQVILSGKSCGVFHRSLPSNVHVGICRDLIANPNFLHEKNNGCNDCMKCHYFSNGVLSLNCKKWGCD